MEMASFFKTQEQTSLVSCSFLSSLGLLRIEGEVGSGLDLSLAKNFVTGLIIYPDY